MKKFSIHFDFIVHGWSPFSMFLNNKPIFYCSGSGVYNPYWDLINILYDLRFSKKSNFKWEIDQEGYDGIVIIKKIGNYLIVSTETLKEKNRTKWDLPKKIFKIKSDEFIKEISTKLYKQYTKQKRDFDNEFYNFSFNKLKMKKILKSN